ncbi:MAG TPA: short-chain fatty acyl-CoA regulator family protein [Ottowia sp.]|uniref:helix-turn-helix domain-containing protein n=1 Tax=Ottowia sp. TaxID=1898956 RepID=UPI002BD03A60|nr:short-chain fatty acyl-CoA regulator family protein [Ottowia sp.]HMN20996.1 short-chain fatty acyl-CoA regulator family protein [Ottowia sp.]
MQRTVVGFKIRQQRRSIGITQKVLADRVGISASYLNLIESNKRNIGGRLLHRIADELQLPIERFDGATDRRLVHDLVDLSSDHLFEDLALTPESAAGLAGQFAQWARALVSLHRSYHDRSEAVTALSDRLSQDPFLGESIHGVLTHVAAIRSASEILEGIDELEEADRARFLGIIDAESARLADVSQALAGFFDRERSATRSLTPVDEVDDFLLENDNHFPRLEDAAAEIRGHAGLAAGSAESRLIAYLGAQHGVRVTLVDALDEGLADPRARSFYEPAARQMVLVATAPLATRRFELGRLAAHLGCAEPIAAELARSALLRSPAAQRRAERALEAYVAGALLLPYDEFFAAVRATRYDVDRLCHRFGVSFEQVCHRLLTLKRPGSEGVRFGFMRSDPAGYVTKRFPLPYLTLPRYGNACPLWAVYRAFQTPGEIVRELAEFPDGRRYFFVARTQDKQPASYNAPRQSISLMLMCEAIHADQLVYGDGLDLSTAAPATPVGPTCRLCVRRNCASRQENPIISS